MRSEVRVRRKYREDRALVANQTPVIPFLMNSLQLPMRFRPKSFRASEAAIPFVIG
jgi:hypothetical protein